MEILLIIIGIVGCISCYSLGYVSGKGDGISIGLEYIKEEKANAESFDL